MKHSVLLPHFGRHSFATILACLLLGLIILPGETTKAESLDLTATVNAPLPTSPAIITSPFHSQRFSTSLATVSGTCGDATYVVLYRNNTSSGVSSCGDGLFSIETNLSFGQEQLQAKVYNSTNNEGPQAPPITVYYDNLTTQAQAQTPPFLTTPNVAKPSDTPLFAGDLSILYAPNGYRTYKTNELWKSDISIAGGTPPYLVTIDWGDGKTSSYTRDTSSAFTIDHAFEKPGNYHPRIRVSDKNNTSAILQILVAVVNPDAHDTANSDTTAATSTSIAIFVATGIVVGTVLLAEIGVALGSFAAGRPPIIKK